MLGKLTGNREENWRNPLGPRDIDPTHGLGKKEKGLVTRLWREKKLTDPVWRALGGGEADATVN